MLHTMDSKGAHKVSTVADEKRQRIDCLMRVEEFRQEYPTLFRTDASIRWHIHRRNQNGLVASGAVVETALGIRIDAERFLDWLLNSRRPTRQPDSNAAA